VPPLSCGRGARSPLPRRAAPARSLGPGAGVAAPPRDRARPRARPLLTGALAAGVAGRAVGGLALALAIAVAARRARALTTGGAAAAVVVGTVAVAAGWAWGALLIAFFVASTALSRWRRVEKERRTCGVVEKGGERDAAQVLANGGAFAVVAAGALAWPDPAWAAAGAGALAAATADTWATEIGTLAAGRPRALLGWRPVPPGTSGAVSAPGTAAMFVGAAFVALVARLLGFAPIVAVAALAGGIAGAVADSVLGATIQSRRWCDRCDVGTEQPTHTCGTPTRPAGGLAAVGNDVVNVACGAVGAAVGWWWAR
jgi:uncharacterized protein (TIGR00297 family)